MILFCTYHYDLDIALKQKSFSVKYSPNTPFSTDNDDADFENSRFGMWTNSYSDKLNWRINSGFTQTMATGPSRDHTNGRGTLNFPFLSHFLTLLALL